MGGRSSDKAQALHAELEQGIAALVSSEDWQRALEQAAKFHHYSFGNQLLIALQRPEATRVAGYKRWQELGRHVRQGEKGLAILAPVTRRVEVEDKQTRERKLVPVLVGFRVVHVFDVSQTDGAELVDVAPVRIEGSEPAGLWEALEQLARRLGFDVERETCGRALGYFDGSKIVVCPEIAGAQACKTLAHEIAHAILHTDLDGVERNRGRFEVEAESVAYIVLRASGVDADGYSFPYVAGWAGGDVKLVTATAERVTTTARRILDSLEGAEELEAVAS